MASGRRFLWYSDTHLNLAWPWALRRFVHDVNANKPDGLFLTGDISNGRCLRKDLEYLANHINCNVYFVLGNHDYHMRSMADVHNDISFLCSKHDNLKWMTREGAVELNPEVVMVGTEGWYDSVFGDSKFLKFTIDWFMTPDFRKRTWPERLEHWKFLAKSSAEHIHNLIQKSLHYKEIFILTHFPPWPEADRAHGSLFEKFWLPYNSNNAMGQMLESVAKAHKSIRFTVLAGHTHSEYTIRVRRNLECRVAPAKYTNGPRREEIFLF